MQQRLISRTGIIAAGVALSVALAGGAAFAAFHQDPAPDSSALTPAEGTAQFDKGRPEVLKNVLDDLVKKGTITQAQEDAILAALKAAVPQARAEMPRIIGDLFKDAATYVGSQPNDIITQLRAGKSLGEIADAAGSGKSRAGLIASLTKAANDRIDKAFADKKITADQVTALKAKVSAEITRFVDHKGGPGVKPFDRPGGPRPGFPGARPTPTPTPKS